jgi:predicted transposase YbfD/YdcC
MALFGRSKRRFLGQFLTLENGIPSHDTVSRVFRLLDPEAFHGWFVEYMKRFAAHCVGVVAIEGKTPRRSHDRASGLSAPHLVNAWAADQRLAPGQVAVADKSNEIAAIPKLLDLLSLKGRTVTPERRNAVVRGHRGIEKQLHWVLDVVFDEDQARNRKDHEPENLALLGKLALNLAKLDPAKGSIRGKLKAAAWDDAVLAKLISRFNGRQMR